MQMSDSMCICSRAGNRVSAPNPSWLLSHLSMSSRPKGIVWSSRGRRSPVRSHAIIPETRAELAMAPLNSPAAPLENFENGVIVAGAGIGGLAAAKALHMLGIPVVVMERAASLPLTGLGIAIWPNALRALDALGVGAAFRSSPAIDRMTIVDQQGTLLVDAKFDDAGLGPHPTRRADIISALAASLPEGTIRYNSALTSVQQDIDGVVVEVAGGQRLRAKALVGADGAMSAVNRYLGLQPPSYSGYSAYRGLAQYPGGIPSDLIGKNVMMQVFGTGVRVGAVPLNAKELYWFVAENRKEADLAHKSAAEYKQDVLKAVEGMAWGIADVIKATPDDTVLRNRIGDRWMRPGQKAGQDCVTLLGDAFHPMTPNMAQGGCTALEDAVVLGQHLKKAMEAGGPGPGEGLGGVGTADLSAALRAYEQERMSRVFPIQIKAYMIGFIGQLAFPPLVKLRNLLIPRLLTPNAMASAAQFDVGSLEA